VLISRGIIGSPINSPDSATKVTDSIESDQAVILLNNQNGAIATLAVDTESLSKLKGTGQAERIIKAISKSNATKVIFKDYNRSIESVEAFQNVARLFDAANIRALDYLSKESGQIGAPRSDMATGDTRITGASGTYFSLNPKITTAREGAAVTSAKANEVIDRITASWSKGRDNIFLVDTFDELPLAITMQAEEYGAKKTEVRGVYHFGKIYLVRENLKSELDVEETLFHEGYGHYGIRELMGKELPRELRRLFYAIGGSRGFNQIAKENGIDLKPYAQGSAKYPVEAKIQIMMDELLAHLAQSNKPGIKRAFKELIGKIRQFLRDRGFLKLSNVSNSELLLVLKNARLAVEGKDAKGYSNNSEVRFNVGDNDGRNTRANSKASFSESRDQADKGERRRLRQLSQKRFRDDAEREFGVPVQNPRSTKPGYYQVTRAGNRVVPNSYFTLDTAGEAF
jgi:hypothetical protein